MHGAVECSVLTTPLSGIDHELWQPYQFQCFPSSPRLHGASCNGPSSLKRAGLDVGVLFSLRSITDTGPARPSELGSYVSGILPWPTRVAALGITRFSFQVFLPTICDLKRPWMVQFITSFRQRNESMNESPARRSELGSDVWQTLPTVKQRIFSVVRRM
jgi:hypothetical protein